MKLKANQIFHYFSDPGHGWLRVPRAHLITLGIADQITHYSYQTGSWVYLEEDRDQLLFCRSWEQATGQQPNCREHFTDNLSTIRTYASYRP